MSSDISIAPIGEAQISDGRFFIQLRPNYRDGLQGLSAFSHAVALWWAHETDKKQLRNRMMIERPYTGSPDDFGVFATRSEARPNPIGLTVFAVSDIDERTGVIASPYFDMEPGTPILDIKPYMPASDKVARPRIPAHFRNWPKTLEASAAFDWRHEFRT